MVAGARIWSGVENHLDLRVGPAATVTLLRLPRYVLRRVRRRHERPAVDCRCIGRSALACSLGLIIGVIHFYFYKNKMCFFFNIKICDCYLIILIPIQNIPSICKKKVLYFCKFVSFYNKYVCII